VLAPEPHRDEGSEPSDHQTLGIDQNPLLRHLGGLGRERFHLRKSVKMQIGANRADCARF
jgi:hypothetical protein